MIFFYALCAVLSMLIVALLIMIPYWVSQMKTPECFSDYPQNSNTFDARCCNSCPAQSKCYEAWRSGIEM